MLRSLPPRLTGALRPPGGIADRLAAVQGRGAAFCRDARIATPGHLASDGWLVAVSNMACQQPFQVADCVSILRSGLQFTGEFVIAHWRRTAETCGRVKVWPVHHPRVPHTTAVAYRGAVPAGWLHLEPPISVRRWKPPDHTGLSERLARMIGGGHRPQQRGGAQSAAGKRWTWRVLRKRRNEKIQSLPSQPR